MIITLKNGNRMNFDKATSLADIAKSLSEGLAREALVAKVNGELKDMSFVVDFDADVNFYTVKDAEGLDVYRHTCSHVLAQAVKSIYPTCKLAIGPTIEDGFYYDFDFRTPITQDDFVKIEDEMKKIIKNDLPVTRFELSRKEAMKLMKEMGEDYKVELIKELPDGEPISFYKQGAFVDLCRGPHLPSTGRIKAFKLLSLTGAYWRGNEKNKMLTRIYATAFEKKSKLDVYIEKLEQAKLRDHNKLGRDLGYFMTSDVIGQGLPLLMPKGVKVMQTMIRSVEDEEE
ncbi:MAG: TGS domain-containing protein, partial [Clostridia bacterium]|nr:TGS domain-containing protein [Clostridia bacterium]